MSPHRQTSPSQAPSSPAVVSPPLRDPASLTHTHCLAHTSLRSPRSGGAPDHHPTPPVTVSLPLFLLRVSSTPRLFNNHLRIGFCPAQHSVTPEGSRSVCHFSVLPPDPERCPPTQALMKISRRTEPGQSCLICHGGGLRMRGGSGEALWFQKDPLLPLGHTDFQEAKNRRGQRWEHRAWRG